MNVIRKISPKGIDVEIDRIQDELEYVFSTWTNFTCYPRIYKEKLKDNKFNPMVFIGNKEYKNVFQNDNLNGSCFFYEENTRSGANNGYFNNTKLSIVFQIKDLWTFYPNVAHRPDEEIHNDIIMALKKVTPNKVVNLVQTIEDVYSEFDTSQVQFDDIGVFHVFRIDMNIIVDNNCK